MPIKIFAAIVAVVLVLSFLSPVVFKLKNVALTVIIRDRHRDDADRPLAIAARAED